MPRVLVLIVWLLLLALQQEASRHGIDHLRAELAQAHERALQLPAEPCDECALLAGAAHAVGGAAADHALFAGEMPAPVSRAIPFTPPPARYYAARGPPSQA